MEEVTCYRCYEPITFATAFPCPDKNDEVVCKACLIDYRNKEMQAKLHQGKND